MIVGISGKSGSGKSSIARYLSDRLDYHVIDVDVLVKRVRDKYKKEIVNIVNNDDVINKGEIDSRKLGNILFENESLMEEYNRFIYSKIKDELEEYKYTNFIIDSMFLPIMEIFAECDYKILVTCDEESRMNRIIKRDNISIDYFKKRDKFSLEYSLSEFDLVLNTSGKYKEELEQFVDKIKAN